MKTAEEKDLNFYRQNAEEDYLTTPISVLRYIGELEKNVPQWISVEERLPTENDADENGKVLVYRQTNESQKSLSKSIYDWSMVKYLDSNSFWMPTIEAPNK